LQGWASRQVKLFLDQANCLLLGDGFMKKFFTHQRLSTAEAVAPLMLTWLASCWAIFFSRFSFYSVVLASVVVMMTFIIARVLRHAPYGRVPGLRVGTIFFAVILSALLFLYPQAGFRVLFIGFMPSVCMLFVWMLVVSLYCFWTPLASVEHQALFVYMLIVLAGLATVDCIWSTGYAAIALQHPAPERFPYTFEIWDRLPFSAHGFLTFDTRWHTYESHRAYTGYPQIFTFVHYLALKTVKAFSGISYARGIRLTQFLYAILFSFLFPFFSLLWTSEKQRKSFCAVLILVFSSVLFVCIPDMWAGMGKYDGDNAFPLFALFHIGVISLLWGRWYISMWWIILWALLYAFMIPLGACLSAVVIVLCASAGNVQARKLAITALTLLVCGLLVFYIPALVGRVIGFDLAGSPWIYRSGLDGSDVYFQNVYQAVFEPMNHTELRPYTLFKTGWVVLGVLLLFAKRYGDNNGTCFTALVAMVGVYFINALLLPQSVSGHPHLYDIIFIMPVFACIPVMLFDDPLNSPRAKVLVPLFFFGSLGIIQHNFTMIMRFVGKHFLN
jgi:hypothetical protein